MPVDKKRRERSKRIADASQGPKSEEFEEEDEEEEEEEEKKKKQ